MELALNPRYSGGS